MSYAPGTFNMGAPFNTYQVPYNQQQNQSYTQNQQYYNNLFAKQSSKTPQQDATAIIAVTPIKEPSTPGKQDQGNDATTRDNMGPQGSCITTYSPRGPVRVTNHTEHLRNNTERN